MKKNKRRQYSFTGIHIHHAILKSFPHEKREDSALSFASAEKKKKKKHFKR